MKSVYEPTDTFDRDSHFAVEYKGRRGAVRTEGYVFDCSDCKINPGVFIMQCSAVLKDKYSEADIDHRARINAEKPVRDGDVVEFNGKQMRVKILGNYSDMGRLIAI